MKKFFLDYGYSCIKMFVNQFAIALFGASLVIAVSTLNAETYGWTVYLVSAFAVLFYLVLIYSIPWKHGATDRIGVDYNKKEKNILIGLYMGLIANTPNFLIAIVSGILGFIAPSSSSEGVKIIGLWLQGMYQGLLQFKIGGVPLFAHWWMLLVITLPAIITSTVAYIAGFNNIRVFKFKEKRNY